MSSRRYDHFQSGLGEDAGESTLFITSTPSGAPTRQAGAGSDIDWGNVINTALPAVLNVYQQQQLTRMNVARINAGQRPITAAEFTAYQPATAQVQVGATPRTEKIMMAVGLGVLALVGLRAAKLI